MNKKGFTLTEILGAIIILGILVVLAVVTFSGSMKGFREDYYTETVRTLTESGKEFFNDNRKYRPSEVLGAQVVPLNTLVAQHYIDDIKDYHGNSCSNTSYVIIIKNGKDDYTYHTCLVCPEDDFSNLNDKYCDSAWTNSTTIEYSIAKPPELYVYKGTPKSALKEMLGIKASYVKKNSKGEVLGVVDGTGFDAAPTIYPDNVDAVDTNKLDKYPLTYRYQSQIVEGHVTIYEYKKPTLTINKENIVAIDLAGNTKKETGEYTSGEWTQKIHVTMTAGKAYAGENVDISTANLKNIVHKYQWNKDGIWHDFCNGDDCTNIEFAEEMNQEIKFRSVDVNGITSEETNPIIIRIDNTKPTCSITSSGPHKNNDEWYTGDVAITFVRYDDLIGTSPEAVSGVKVKNITIETGTLNRSNDVLNQNHIQDTRGIKYIGYVEDNAKNFIRCETFFKRDASNPVCTITGHATLNCNDPFSGLVKVSYTQTNNYTGGTTFSPTPIWADTRTITTKGRWYLRAFDYAGNSSQVSSMYCLITYDKNGGDTEPAKKTEVKRETELADLSQVTRKAQYKMVGWNTSSSATTGLSSYTVQEETDRTLYAIYTKCGKGYYTNASGDACNQCPEGYRDGEPAGDITGCEKKVPCGNYVKIAQSQEIKCSAGYYSTEHRIKYGQTSSCTLADNGYYAPIGSCSQTQCPANYRDGTAIANKTSQSACLNNVPCGKHVANANADEVNCDAGYYSSAHSVTYGSTSSCTLASNGYYATAGSCSQTQCPANYRDGTALANKTSQSACLNSVACGKHVASANGDEVNCDAGYYSTAHSVTYGSTSSCTVASNGYYATAGSCTQTQCPANYRDGTALANKTSQSVCLNSVACGKYVASSNAAESNCPAGYYSSAHSVTYGGTSSCTFVSDGYYATAGSCNQTQCPANYRDGTALANKTSQSVCLNNVACGKHVATANGAEVDCDAGYYSGAHSVTYGGTSSCTGASNGYYATAASCSQTQCPEGYRDGSGTTAQSNCIKNVAKNNEVVTKYGGATSCLTGYSSNAHTVKYGSTSSCSPNTYTLTYDNNGGSGCSSKTGSYGSAWGNLCTPSKSGNDFTGWYTSKTGGTLVTKDSTVSGDLTVYAHWEESNKEPTVDLRRLRGTPSGTCGTASINESMSTVCTTCTGSTCPCVIQALYISPPSGYTFSEVEVKFSPVPSDHSEATNTWTTSSGTKSFSEYTYFSVTDSNNASYGEQGVGTNKNFFTSGSTVILRFRNENGTNGITVTVNVTYTNGATGSFSHSYGVNSSGCCSASKSC